ncbi:hypothetical protein Nmel_001092, partial [Mimus melanotis]
MTGTAITEDTPALPRSFTSVLTCAEKKPQPCDPRTPFPLLAAGTQGWPGGSLRCDLPIHTSSPFPGGVSLPHGT